MSGLDHNRKRNQTICFRATPEERKEIEARIKVSGMPKGEYCRQSLLHQKNRNKCREVSKRSFKRRN